MEVSIDYDLEEFNKAEEKIKEGLDNDTLTEFIYTKKMMKEKESDLFFLNNKVKIIYKINSFHNRKIGKIIQNKEIIGFEVEGIFPLRIKFGWSSIDKSFYFKYLDFKQLCSEDEYYFFNEHLIGSPHEIISD